MQLVLLLILTTQEGQDTELQEWQKTLQVEKLTEMHICILFLVVQEQVEGVQISKVVAMMAQEEEGEEAAPC